MSRTCPWPRSCGAVRDRRTVQQWIELAVVLKGVEVVAAADMKRANENLRHGVPAIGALDHLSAQGAVARYVNLVKGHALLLEQRLGVEAKRAVRRGVDL